MTDDCTEALLSLIREALMDGTLTPLEIAHERWQRGQDGVVRRQVVARRFFAFRGDARTSPPYERTREAIRNDPDFGALVGWMIGDSMGTSRFDESTVINRALNALLTEGETPEMNEQAVRDEIAALRGYVNATERPSKVLIPLPGLQGALLPVELEGGFQIDILSDDEITACAATGILQPSFPAMPMFTEDECAGVRIAITTPAAKVAPGSQPASAASGEALSAPHGFGERSPLRLAELVEDVLFVMRLARPEAITTRGAVHVQDGLHLGTSYQWMTRATHHMVGTRYVIDDAAATAIGELWGVLSNPRGQSLSRICLRRFNAAIDRISAEDAIVDHVIAAEALFLKDAGGPEERGELGFRLALRAGALLEATGRHRRSTFKFMKKAYDLRSKVAHGGSIEQEISVPERGTVPLGQFVDELGGVMREALTRAVHEYSSPSNFATQAFWDELLLGPREAAPESGQHD